MSDKLKALYWLLRDASGKTYSSPEEAEEYNKIAVKYFEREKLAEYIAKTFQELIPCGGTVIDSAAGTGIITKALAIKGFNVVALDISPHQLDFLKSSISGITTTVSDINSHINCEDESVNGITQVGASRFMTVEGQELFVKEAARTLKEDGIFIYPVFFGEIPSSKRRHGLKQKSFSFEISKFIEKCGFE
ncbi:methyltransferase domain-containing protein, partial [Patescibacteria group bacterium]|nr:methyltransferase domain-containing protein [Patescibacteria group bacterium]